MRMLLIVCWAATLVGCCVGLVTLLTALGGANSAIQEAAGGALAAAMAVVPYVFTRAIEGIAAARTSA